MSSSVKVASFDVQVSCNYPTGRALTFSRIDNYTDAVYTITNVSDVTVETTAYVSGLADQNFTIDGESVSQKSYNLASGETATCTVRLYANDTDVSENLNVKFDTVQKD